MTFEDRLCAAPISWGVCEVPGWGRQLPAERVLAEMVQVGLPATELGAPGFLPDTSAGVLAALRPFGMRLVGGFVPLALHDPQQRDEALAYAERTAAVLAESGAGAFVTAAVMDPQWSEPVRLDDGALATLVDGLARVDEICARHGLVQALHPHVGTVVETREDVERVLAASDVGWTLDTGHLAIGGYDPLQFASDAGARVKHVHLKDVDLEVARRVARRETSLLHGVQEGMFRPLGSGDVAVDAIVVELEKAGYEGLYVLEQDVAMTGEEPPPGTGPVEDVAACLTYLREKVVPLIPPRAGS
jgi:inosose dehydratase